METYNFKLNDKKEVVLDELDFVLKPISQIEEHQMPNEETHHPGDLILSASLSGDKEALFLIDIENDPGFKKWSMHLFYSAVEYYCQVVLDQETQGISMAFMSAFYPYER